MKVLPHCFPTLRSLLLARTLILLLGNSLPFVALLIALGQFFANRQFPVNFSRNAL
jgi:hypothetical protein